MAVDLMQQTRVVAFTTLVNLARDTNLDPQVRLNAALAILAYSENQNVNWEFEPTEEAPSLDDGFWGATEESESLDAEGSPTSPA